MVKKTTKQKIEDILYQDLVNLGNTHENAPPGHDCMEECNVSIDDLIDASNPITSQMRSDGEKHKPCIKCWEDYISKLADKILDCIKE